MTYSFFGTCANDHEQFFDCLETMLWQSVSPKEIILINSGEKDIKEIIQNKINKKIKFIYIFKKLSRVKALNLAIELSNSKYSFRFDSRARFSKKYAESALDILRNKKLKAEVIGGVPEILNEKNNFESILCSEIMNRSYIFFYPKHRDLYYSGYASSIYLGCFDTNILKEIKFNENESLLSEDSLIINDFLEKGYKAYLSSNLKISYVCRSSIFNILRLFNTYGYCRANTILLTKKIFISMRHFIVCFFLINAIFFLAQVSFKLLIFFPLFLLIINLFGETISIRRSFKIYIPFYATLCQFSWIIGFLWSFISILKKKKKQSNFIS